jgi:hypothetical protein
VRLLDHIKQAVGAWKSYPSRRPARSTAASRTIRLTRGLTESKSGQPVLYQLPNARDRPSVEQLGLSQLASTFGWHFAQ